MTLTLDATFSFWKAVGVIFDFVDSVLMARDLTCFAVFLGAFLGAFWEPPSWHASSGLRSQLLGLRSELLGGLRNSPVDNSLLGDGFSVLNLQEQRFHNFRVLAAGAFHESSVRVSQVLHLQRTCENASVCARGERWIDLARGDAREVPPKRHTRHRVAPVGVHAAAEHDIACGSGSGEGEDEAVRKSSRVARGAGCGFAGPPL